MSLIYENIKSGKYENKLEWPKRDCPDRVIKMKEYNIESGRLNQLFKEDLEWEFGVSGNPKKDRLFEIAWDKGHSSGYNEVYNEYMELVDLIN